MSDAKLRDLERRWKETGSPDDEAAYLLERVRVGDLSRERLELAAYCGHEGARRATRTDGTRLQDREWRQAVANSHEAIVVSAFVEASTECARRLALSEREDDLSVQTRKALQVLASWYPGLETTEGLSVAADLFLAAVNATDERGSQRESLALAVRQALAAVSKYDDRASWSFLLNRALDCLGSAHGSLPNESLRTLLSNAIIRHCRI